MQELKGKAIPSHTAGIYLEKPNPKELQTRAIEKEKRVEELKEVEKRL